MDTLIDPLCRSVPTLPPDVETDRRAGLVIVSNSIAPYRVNLHRLIAAGIPELKLHSLITHGVGDFDWQVDLPAEIHAANVSAAGEHPLDNPLRRPVVEIRKAIRLMRLLAENNARAVIFNGYRYISYLALMAYCHRHQIPFFLRSDSNFRNEPNLPFTQRMIKRWIYNWWMKRAAGVLSMGQLGDQFFLKYGADPRRIYRVPYWPDFDAFARVDPYALQRFQRKFGLDGRRRYLLYCGRLVPQKRVDLLIDAFSLIADKRPGWDLLIAGDGALGSEVRRRVPDALRHRVVWTGFLDRDEPALAYHSADVLVLPSDKEPWALVVQEAMAAGLTVVASDVVGAAHELVADGISGRIFTRGNCNSLRQALEDVTHSDRIAAFKQQAALALRSYRQQVDPVAEIRRALTDVGVLTAAASESPEARK